jgi:hypothetical protein
MARFKIAWLAEITGRGTAIAGEVIDGVVRVGDLIVGPDGVPGVPFAIRGVEAADRISTGESWVSLIVPPPPAGPAPSALRDALSAGTVLEIVSDAHGARAHRDPPHNVR